MDWFKVVTIIILLTLMVFRFKDERKSSESLALLETRLEYSRGLTEYYKDKAIKLEQANMKWVTRFHDLEVKSEKMFIELQSYKEE